MLYVFLCTFVMIIAVGFLHQHILQLADSLHSEEVRRPSTARLIGVLTMGFAFSAPMVMVLFEVALMGTAYELPQGGGTGRIYTMLAGAVLCLVGAALWALQAVKANSIGFWATGRVVVLLLAGAVGSVSAFKHLTFFSDPNGGVANMGILRDMFELGDMKDCQAGVALVQFNETGESGPVKYRCPTTIMFNQGSNRPFAPWPDYVEGSSKDLAEAILKVSEASEQSASIPLLEDK
jgi:hypothetical protein